jgi:hypothetical protein
MSRRIATTPFFVSQNAENICSQRKERRRNRRKNWKRLTEVKAKRKEKIHIEQIRLKNKEG